MSVTVVNHWWFKPDGDTAKGIKAAEDLVAYFRTHVPEVQLSLWLRERENPRSFFHITVFTTAEAAQRTGEAQGIRRFVQELFPEIIQDESFTAPVCDVWLSSGGALDPVPLKSS